MSQHPEFFIAVQSGISTVILGDPGTTKTRTVEAFNRFVNRDLEIVIPSQREPADICGYPCLQDYEWRNGDNTTHKEKCCEFVPAAWRRRLEHSPRGGIAFFDEVLDCSPSHQAAIQQVLNDGIPNTWVCGAGNPVAVSTNGHELSAPVVNRLCVLNWDTPLSDWKQNMLSGFAERRHSFPILPPNWTDNIVEARGQVIGFLDSKPDLAQKLPKERSKQGEPWPSLRSWTNAATLIAANMSVGADPTLEMKLVNGCVGSGAGLAFATWKKHLDLPPVPLVLEDPSLVDWQGRGDKVYAITAAVLAHVIGKGTEEMWNRGWDVLCYAHDKGAISIATPAASTLAKNRPADAVFPSKVEKTFRSTTIEICERDN